MHVHICKSAHHMVLLSHLISWQQALWQCGFFMGHLATLLVTVEDRKDAQMNMCPDVLHVNLHHSKSA